MADSGKSRENWRGDFNLLVAPVIPFVDEHGQVAYSQQWHDPAAPIQIMQLKDKLTALAEVAPRHNVSWATFVLVIMHGFQMKKLVLDAVGPTIAARRKKAEEIATVLRTLCRHIRREWYRKNASGWMQAFPRPHGDVDAAGEHDSRPRAIPATGLVTSEPLAGSVSALATNPAPVARAQDAAAVSAPAVHDDWEDDMLQIGDMSQDSVVCIGGPAIRKETVVVSEAEEDDDEDAEEEVDISYEYSFDGMKAVRQLVVSGEQCGPAEECVAIQPPPSGEIGDR